MSRALARPTLSENIGMRTDPKPLAMQGTGRMALYAGLHPAQLKDSVTSENTVFC